jgi:hypothetical protein
MDQRWPLSVGLPQPPMSRSGTSTFPPRLRAGGAGRGAEHARTGGGREVQGVQLMQATGVEFARRASALSWDADQLETKLLSPEKLLAAVRNGDAATDF